MSDEGRPAGLPPAVWVSVLTGGGVAGLGVAATVAGSNGMVVLAVLVADLGVCSYVAYRSGIKQGARIYSDAVRTTIGRGEGHQRRGMIR